MRSMTLLQALCKLRCPAYGKISFLVTWLAFRPRAAATSDVNWVLDAAEQSDRAPKSEKAMGRLSKYLQGDDEANVVGHGMTMHCDSVHNLQSCSAGKGPQVGGLIAWKRGAGTLHPPRDVGVDVSSRQCLKVSTHALSHHEYPLVLQHGLVLSLVVCMLT
jgi:hypothetical protein